MKLGHRQTRKRNVSYVPCPHCGELRAMQMMSRHIRSCDKVKRWERQQNKEPQIKEEETLDALDNLLESLHGLE